MKLNKNQANLLIGCLGMKELSEFLNITYDELLLVKDFILAFSRGREVEWFDPTDNVWRCTTEIDFSYKPDQYRIKPIVNYININGYKVPEPVKCLEQECVNQLVSITTDPDRFVRFHEYQILSWWENAVRRGAVHDSISSAKKHIDALLSFTNGKGKGSEWE